MIDEALLIDIIRECKAVAVSRSGEFAFYLFGKRVPLHRFKMSIKRLKKGEIAIIKMY